MTEVSGIARINLAGMDTDDLLRLRAAALALTDPERARPLREAIEDELMARGVVWGANDGV